MMKNWQKFVVALVVWIFCPQLAFAQADPCAAVPPTQPVVNPHTLLSNLNVAEHNTSDVTNYLVGYFLSTQDPNQSNPTFGPFTLQKSAFTLQPATTNCFAVALPAAALVNGQLYVASLKGHRAADPVTGTSALDSAWSGVSNPFVLAPTVLTAPGRPIVRQ